jgi:hypothetical protein
MSNTEQITPKEKAAELVNMYYNSTAKSQQEAVRMAENAIFTRMCQEVDDIDIHINEWDFDLVKSRLKILKWNQEIAAELQNLN